MFCWVKGTVIYIVLLLYPCQSNSIPVNFAGIVLGHIVAVTLHQGGALRGNKTYSAADKCICIIAFDLVSVTKGDRINISKGKRKKLAQLLRGRLYIVRYCILPTSASACYR